MTGDAETKASSAEAVFTRSNGSVNYSSRQRPDPLRANVAYFGTRPDPAGASFGSHAALHVTKTELACLGHSRGDDGARGEGNRRDHEDRDTKVEGVRDDAGQNRAQRVAEIAPQPVNAQR